MPIIAPATIGMLKTSTKNGTSYIVLFRMSDQSSGGNAANVTPTITRVMIKLNNVAVKTCRKIGIISASPRYLRKAVMSQFSPAVVLYHSFPSDIKATDSSASSDACPKYEPAQKSNCDGHSVPLRMARK